MRKDVIANTYHKVAGLPFVEVEFAKETYNTATLRGTIEPNADLDTVFAIAPQLIPLVNRILKKKPHWSFKAVVDSYYALRKDHNDKFSIPALRVFDGDEELGFIRWARQNGWGKEGFEYDNFRLNSARARNRASFSTKENVVATRVVKMFYSKTPLEVMEEAVKKATNAVGSARSKHFYAVQNAYRDIQTDVYEYIANNWETMQPLIGGRAKNIDLPALIQAKNDAKYLSAAKNTWVVVAQSNGRYIARHDPDVTGTLQTFTDADLPPRLRMGLGLLKMVEDGEMIPGIGVRAEHDTFFIAEEGTNV